MRFPSVRTRPIAAVLTSAVLLLVPILHRFDPLKEGLTATFFSDAAWSSVRGASFIDSVPSTESFPRVFGGRPPETFSATWEGTIAVVRNGLYTFAVDSDDAAWLYVDDVLVVDNSGRHSSTQARGTIGLTSGAHRLRVKYAQYGGEASLSLFWARGGETLRPISPAFLFPEPAGPLHLRASVFLREVFPFVAWIWVAVVVAGIARVTWPRIETIASTIRSDPTARLLGAIVCASLALNVVGVWWGVPSAWAGDEIAPQTVLRAIDLRFSGGWFDRYPPFHMQVISAAFAPWLLLRSAGLVHLSEAAEYGVLLVTSRLVSVLAGIGTILVLFRVGRESFGDRAGLLGAAAFALLTPFLYYAKTANPEVPYVFWFAVSLLFYLRALRATRLTDVVGFAVAAILSICTKDQAYGLYVLTPIPLVFRLWEVHRDAGERRPLLRVATDRRIWVPFGAAVVLFSAVHNIPFNAEGFMKHVRDITGPGQSGYQMVDSTISGRLSLLRIVADLNQRSWGWPLWLATLAGIGIAVVSRSTRRTALVLLLVIVSYHLGFMNVVRYAFDRYLLPFCAIEALFIGVALDRLLGSEGMHLLAARVAVAATFAYTLLYAGTVDVLMVRDSRYPAERWLRARDAEHRLVGIVFPETVLPRLRDFLVTEIETVSDLEEARPAFFVLNADYARAVPAGRPGSELAAGLQRETLGYRLAFRSSRPSPWPWLPLAHPNLAGPRDEIPVLSVLSELSPTIEIYARDDRDDAR